MSKKTDNSLLIKIFPLTIFVTVGVMLLVVAFASNNFVAFDVTETSNSSQITDNTAHNGSYVEFGSSVEPPDDDRPVVTVAGSGQELLASNSNTIYELSGNFTNVQITAVENTEVRGDFSASSLRIGTRDGKERRNIGFRGTGSLIKFRFAHVQVDGSDLYDPYFIGIRDSNPQPHQGDNDILQFFAYRGGDVVRPVLDDAVIYGKQRPAGSIAHNDSVQITSTGGGGGVVYDPTIRNSVLEGASNAAIQAANWSGTFTIENNTLTRRFESFFGVNINPPIAEGGSLLWLNNKMTGNAAIRETILHPDSDVTADSDGRILGNN